MSDSTRTRVRRVGSRRSPSAPPRAPVCPPERTSGPVPSPLSIVYVRMSRKIPCAWSRVFTSSASCRHSTIDGPSSMTRAAESQRSGRGRRTGSGSPVSAIRSTVACSSRTSSVRESTVRRSGLIARPSARGDRRARTPCTPTERDGRPRSPGPAGAYSPCGSTEGLSRSGPGPPWSTSRSRASSASSSGPGAGRGPACRSGGGPSSGSPAPRATASQRTSSSSSVDTSTPALPSTAVSRSNIRRRPGSGRRSPAAARSPSLRRRPAGARR